MPGQVPEPPGDLAELRELLVGDHEQRIEDLAQVLPATIKSGKAKGLRDALEPIVERSFHSSVRKNPKELADAIYPIIGPAIRTSIAAAIRDFAEALNQVVEKSVSFRAIRWRIEALITGKPFSEILLSRSLLYSVEQVFLIHRPSGLLLQHAAAQGSVLKDADMISGMLTAIQDFLSDSFTDGGQELETVDAGRFKLWLTYGPKLLLVGAVSGTAPVELKKKFRKALDDIEAALQSQISHFKQDDLSVFEPALPFLEACLLGQSAPAKQKKARLWPYLLGLALIVGGLLGYRAYERARWNDYFEALKRQPGIVVTGVEKNGSDYTITGLRDPAAVDPLTLLRRRGLNARRAKFAMEPYLSLDTQFAAERELSAAKQSIEMRIIRFDSGSSKLTSSEADRIDDIMAVVRQVIARSPGTTITITGRADETGSGDTNDKLALDRANQVRDAFLAQGIAPGAIVVIAAGNRQPLRTGGTEWDRSVNRSVSFTVNTGAAK